MPIEFKKSVAVFTGVCAIEEAEPLLEYLIEQPKSKINLKKCRHLHTAVLQVLMCAKPKASSPPEDAEMASWLLPLLE